MNDTRLKFSVKGVLKNDRLYGLINEAHDLLGDVVGSSGPDVEDAWSVEKDSKGRPLILLKLSDFKGRAEAKFAPDELENPRQMSYRLIRLWGDVLQDRSHKQLAEMMDEQGSEDAANGS